MDNEQPSNADICAITDTNLHGVLFSDYGNENLIVSSDIANSLSSLEGAWCYDESTSELLYVSVVPSNVTSTEVPAIPQSVLSTLSASVPSLSDVPMFTDGGQIMLLTNASLVIPNENNAVAASGSDPFILEYLLNPPNQDEKSNTPSLKSSDPDDDLIKHKKNNDNTNEQKIVNKDDSTKACKSPPSFQNEDAADGIGQADPNKMRYLCKLCNEKFNLLKEYKTHLLVHKDKIFKCRLCPSSFNKFKNLTLHEATHNVHDDATCPLANCQKKFKRLASLKAHMKLHEEEESLICSECGEEFRNQLCLELHYKYESQCRISNTGSSVMDKAYRCKLCGRQFKDVNEFAAHKKEHEKIKKALATRNHKKKPTCSTSSSRINRCKMCPKWFLKPSQLIRHMRIHTGERPFECTVCNKAFNQANSLKIHMLKHTGDRPYQCTFCSMSFSQRGNLRQHINRVHSIPKVEERVYECIECSCIFKKLCSLNAHKNRVHQKRYNNADDKIKCEETENLITIEHGIEDIEDDDFNELLEKKSTVNTITVTLERENGSIWHQNVFVNKKGNNRFYRCSHCPKQSSKLKEIIRHLKLNILGKPFKCDFCPTKFSQHSTYLTHLNLHATAKKYICEICQQSFFNPTELKIHLQSHELQLCTVCFKSFNSCDIKNHQCSPPVQSQVPSSSPQINQPKEQSVENSYGSKVKGDKINLILPPYTCTHCNTIYESYPKLKQHLQTHDINLCKLYCVPTEVEQNTADHRRDIKMLTCNKCGEIFQTRGERNLHLKSHREIAKTVCEFKCTQCGKEYSRRLSLKRHEKRAHQSVKQVNEPAMNTEVSTMNDTRSNNILFNAISDLKIDAADVVIPPGTQSSSEIISVTEQAARFDAIETENENKNTKAINTGTENLTSVLDSKVMDSDLAAVDSLVQCIFDIQTNDGSSESTESLPAILNLPGIILYRCVKCLQQYATEADLQKHAQESETCSNGMANLTNVYFFACSICYLTFKNLPTLLKHLQTHEGFPSFHCLYCGAANRSQTELTQHIAQHALNEEYPCMHCGELYDSAESVKKHITYTHLMSSVDNNKPESKRRKNIGNELLLSEKEKLELACQKPNKYSSISEKILSSLLVQKESVKEVVQKPESAAEVEFDNVSKGKKRKIYSSNGSKENACSHCGRTFKKMCDLVRHIRTHTGEKPFKCDYCNKCFRVKSILNCHLKTHFTVNNVFCHICNRFFSTVGSLKIHMRLHTGDRPYKCLFCKEKFRTSGHRDSHQKKHLNNKDKSKMDDSPKSVMIEIQSNDGLELNLDDNVNFSDMQFILPDMAVPDTFKFQDTDLGELQNITVIKPMISCSICHESFRKKCDLDKHMNVHLSENQYSCTTCDAKFKELEILKMHMKRHTQTNSMNCDRCNRSFASPKNLKLHKARHHPEKLNLSIQDENEPEHGTDINESEKETDKWTEQSELTLSNVMDKHSILKRQDNMTDFYVIDKSFDLTMGDFFPE